MDYAGGDARQRVPHAVLVLQRRREAPAPAEVVADADEDEPLPGLRNAEPLGVEDARLDPVSALSARENE